MTLAQMFAFENITRIWEQVIQNTMQWQDQVIDLERIPVAIFSILLTMVTGVLVGTKFGNIYPFFWSLLDKSIGILGDRLDKRQRSKADLIFRGFIVSMFTLVLFTLMARTLQDFTFVMPYQEIAMVVLLSLCLSSGAIWRALYALYALFEEMDKEKTSKKKFKSKHTNTILSEFFSEKKTGQSVFYAISRSSRIDLTSTDQYGITRTGMALAARSFDKAMVAPVLWFLVGGIPVVFLYTALAALAWRFGKDGFTKGFGSMALALDKIMGTVPSLFAALILTIASLFTPHAQLRKGFLSWFHTHFPVPYAQGGKPLKAFAWALGVSLGGAVQDINGSSLQNAWVGPPQATAQISHKHLHQAIYIHAVSHFLLIVMLGGVYLWWG